ncbi:MAG TPA: M28 family peptidase [Chryseolinea sp.]|nr:M28 family peptidase [Chryseolinea sp.]
MRLVPLLVMLFLITHCNYSQKKNNAEFEAIILSDASQYDLPDNFFTTLIEEQKKLVAALTGSSEISANAVIDRRWTLEQKSLARNYLSGSIKRIHQIPKEHSYETKLPEKYKNTTLFKGVNLYTIIPSTMASSEYVIIGAHYDTFKETPGADDNASGCALVYGLGKMLTQLEKRSKNIILVFLDEEETGHAGSLAFANWLKSQEFDVHSVHTADEVGWDHDEDRNIELELPSSYLESLYRKHAEPFEIKLYRTNTTGSDHREFREAGFQAVGVTEEYKNGDGNPHHHKRSDTFEKLDYQFLAFTTYLVFKVVEEIVSE